MSSANRSWPSAGVVLLIAFAVFYLLTLGIRPLSRPDEFRYAEIAREMLTSGDWVTPRFNGVRYFEKPVLGHWVNAASLAVFGENAFAVRLPMALTTGLTALFLHGFVRRQTRRAALAIDTSTIQLSFLAVWAMGSMAILDPILGLWLTLSVGLWYESHVAPPAKRRRLQALVGICCGLAFLTKGFLALAIPVLIVGPFLAWQRDWRRLLDDAWLPVLVAAAVVAPWGLLIHSHEPDFWRYFFWEEHIRRYFSGERAQHSQPFWLFFAALPAMALPWTFHAPAALLGLRRASPELQLDPRLLRFTVLWFAMPLLFFSASSGKLLSYILPCFPPLALLLAHGVERYRASGRRIALERGTVGLALLFAAGFGYLLGNGLGAFGKPLFGAGESLRWILSLAACAWGAWIAGRHARRAADDPVRVLGISLAGLLLAIPVVIPDATRDSKMPGPFLEEQKALVAPDAVIIVKGQLVGSVAWVFKRSDLYVFEPNELEYGLSQPDAAGRGVDSAGIRRLIQANAGKRDVLIITRVKDNARAAAVVPPDTRHVQQGALAAWYITAAKPDPDAQSMTSTLAPRM